MIKAQRVVQQVSYSDVGYELEEWLERIQEKWKYKVLGVYPIKANKNWNNDDKGFVIIYEVPEE